jgi:transposase
LRVPVPPGSRKRLNLIGSVDWVSGEVEARVVGEHSVTAQDVLGWLDGLADRAQAINKPIILVLDNASIHTAALIKAKLETWQARGLYIGLLPPYSPHLNLMECPWRKLKHQLLERRAYPDLAALRSAVEAALPKLRLPPLQVQTAAG